jgi:hypothetical protein
MREPSRPTLAINGLGNSTVLLSKKSIFGDSCPEVLSWAGRGPLGNSRCFSARQGTKLLCLTVLFGVCSGNPLGDS